MKQSWPTVGLSASLILCTIAATLALSTSVVRADDVDPALIEKWSELVPVEPLGLGRPIGDRDAWEDVKKRLPKLKDYVTHAEKLIGNPIPRVTDDLYLEFSRNGNRRRYEKVMIEKSRNRITTLTIAECQENKGRFLPEIERIVRAVCKQKSWVLPAHDRDLTNFKGTRITIDLFSSEIGLQLATLSYWLGDRLSPEIRKSINTELERRIFKPFEGAVEHNKPRLWWLHCTNNWNAVCLANVAGAAATSIDSPQRRAFFMAAAEQHIRHFLSGFTPDGYCSEGLAYWGYGFGHFALLAEILSQQSGGKVVLWDTGTPNEQAKLRRIARFPQRMEVMPDIYPAFADCDITTRPQQYLMNYLDRRLGFGWNRHTDTLFTLDQPIRNVQIFGAFVFPNSATSRPPAKTEADKLSSREWFENAGVLICRPGEEAQDHCKMGVAIKGGHNAEHHNHNDVGTFIVAVGNKVPLIDPGREDYTRRTFSSKRYASGVLNSWGHPVPRVAGKLQRKGRKAAANVLSKKFGDRTDTITFDISRAYDVKPLKRLERTFEYTRKAAGSLEVTDVVEFDSPQSFGTALITFDKWEQIEPKSKTPSNSITLRVGSGSEAVDVVIECMESTFDIHPKTIDEDLTCKKKPTRLGIDFTKPVKQATVRTTIRPSGT
ncbi:MAG: heparinase II/III family protein [Pirellulales bacterium]|nr:heparinase II/III family protein [Pirellulales bacterium]